MTISGQAIGVLGGTFDPVHNGHIAIANSFLSSGYINSLLILLTPTPPHKKGHQLTNYNERLRMLLAAFNSVEQTKVSDLEYTLTEPSYTYQTLRYLKKSNPAASFYLCVGEDSYNDFKKWYKWKGILTMSELLVAARGGIKRNDENKDLRDSTHFIEHKPISVSSTEIRERLKNGKPVKKFLPESVLEIIKKEDLYQ